MCEHDVLLNVHAACVRPQNVVDTMQHAPNVHNVLVRSGDIGLGDARHCIAPRVYATRRDPYRLIGVPCL